MASILRIKRSTGSSAPASLANAELAYAEGSDQLFIGVGTGGSGGSATVIKQVGGGLWSTKTANYVYAGPTSGSAATPSFRALVAGDIPDISSTYLTVSAAGSTYLSQSSAASTYLSQSSAASTYAPLASPTFTGVPAAPTASAGTNTTQVATTAFVSSAISTLINSAPSALDTLNELAAALGNDASFSTTVTNSLAGKLTASNNLSDVSSAGTARTNLGLGSMATQSASSVAITGGTIDNVTFDMGTF